MSRLRILLVGTAILGLAVSGGVVAGGWQNAPAQDARPASGDPIGDALRSNASTEESAPAGDPAPARPIAITPPTPDISIEAEAAKAGDNPEEGVDTGKSDQDEESEADKAKRLASDTPVPRQRRRVAIVEAIDKITAERMRFEVEVGGRPVRFNQALIFSARACEVSAPNELVEDAVAYLDVSLQPKVEGAAPRQIFRGWMFASTPALSGLQHPIYDAWVVGCKA